MIAAMAHHRIIGAGNKMPWHLPADLKHFKSVTMGKPVIMGRKTYESIGKALPGRTNIVISRQASYQLNDAVVVSDISAALEYAKQFDDIMVIGGGSIYEAMLPLADVLYLTFIDLDVLGDTQFPDYSAMGTWLETSSEYHQADENNPHAYRFVKLLKAN